MKHAIRAGRRSAAAFACTAALAIGGASAALPFWTADGGTPQRTSAASLDTDITQFKAVSLAIATSNGLEFCRLTRPITVSAALDRYF